jgi:hypothetical protein
VVLPVTSARARCGCGRGGRRGRIRCIARRCGLGRWGRCVRSRWSRRVSCTSTSVECGWRGAAAKWLGHRAPRASERGTGRPWRVRLRARSPSFACRRCQRQPKTDQWTACRALFSFQMPSTVAASVLERLADVGVGVVHLAVGPAETVLRPFACRRQGQPEGVPGEVDHI